jgi:hypothetical protein
MSFFGDIGDQLLPLLAGVLQGTLKKIAKVRTAEPFVFNYYISHGPNWFMRIVPRFIHRAGFELGTGLNVNVVDPTVAAKELSSVKI